MDCEEEQMPYAVVKFIDDPSDDTVSEIPTKWLYNNNTMCYWPTAKNVATYIAKAVEPNENTWTSNQVEVEFFCKSQHTARKKAEDINYSSSDELKTAVKRRPKKHFPLEEWESGDSDSSILSKKRTKVAVSPPPTFSNSDILNMPVILGNIESPVTKDILMAAPESITDNPVECNDNSSATVLEIAGPSTVSDDCHTCSLYGNLSSPGISSGSSLNLNDLQILHKIWDAVSEIKIQMVELHDKVLYNENYNAGPDDSFSILKQYLPVADLDALTNFEEFLEPEENIKLFKKFVNCIGGSGPKENIHRILKKVYSDTMAVKCSWLGQRNNHRMCDKQSMISIKGVILNVYKMRENEFESISSEWFRHARQRLNRKKTI